MNECVPCLCLRKRLYIYLYVLMYMYARGGQRLLLHVLFICLPPYVLRQVFSLNLEIAILARLDG